MATSLTVNRQFKTQICSACDLELYNNGQSCTACGNVFCASCYSMKAKLDLSFQTMTSATDSCISCEKIINLKKLRELSSSLPKGDKTESATANNSTSDSEQKSSLKPYKKGKVATSEISMKVYSGNSAGTGQNKDGHGHCNHHHLCYHNVHGHHPVCSDCGRDSYYCHNCGTYHNRNDSKTDSTRNEQIPDDHEDSLYGDIPSALVICGLVSYEEVQISIHEQRIKALQEKIALTKQIAGNNKQIASLQGSIQAIDTANLSQSNFMKNANKTGPSSPVQDMLGQEFDVNRQSNITVADNQGKSVEKEDDLNMNYEEMYKSWPQSTASKLESDKKSASKSSLDDDKLHGNVLKENKKYKKNSADRNSVLQGTPVNTGAHVLRHSSKNISMETRSTEYRNTSVQKSNESEDLTAKETMDGNATTKNTFVDKNTTAQKSTVDVNCVAQKGPVDGNTAFQNKAVPGNATEHGSSVEDLVKAQDTLVDGTATEVKSPEYGNSTSQKSNKGGHATAFKIDIDGNGVVHEGSLNKSIVEQLHASNVEQTNTSTIEQTNTSTVEQTHSSIVEQTYSNQENTWKVKHQEQLVENNFPGHGHVENGKDMFLVKHFVHSNDTPQKPVSHEKSNNIPDVPKFVTKKTLSGRERGKKGLKASKKTTESSRKADDFLNLDDLERGKFIDDGHSTPYAISITQPQRINEATRLLLILSGFESPTKNKSKTKLVVEEKPCDEKTSIYTKGARQYENACLVTDKHNFSKNNMSPLSVKNMQTSTAESNMRTSTAETAQSTSNVRPFSSKVSSSGGKNSTLYSNANRIPQHNTSVSASFESTSPSSAIPSACKMPTSSNIPTRTASKNQTMPQSASTHVLRLRGTDKESLLARQYHEGFVRLKQKQSEGKPKCNSCGRPECKGENLQSVSRMIRSARENGFQLQDVAPDGNCMFAAVIDQMLLYGDKKFTSQSLREAAVIWLVDNPFTESGTPRSEFLAEDWYHYIDRMGREGEWGDHMILGAIVEVIGCTIRVMSPTDAEPHWTVLEPQSTGLKKDDKHLILGHVGEFHYTSLRPADKHVEETGGAKSPAAETQDLAVKDRFTTETEADRLVAVFSNDHIDEQSDMPTAHFSYLLKTIFPKECLDLAAIYMSQCCLPETEMDVREDGSYSGKCVGPIAEGVHVPHIDEYVSPNSQAITCTQTFLSIGMDRKFKSSDCPDSDFIIEEDQVHAGNTRLRQRSTNVYYIWPKSSYQSPPLPTSRPAGSDYRYPPFFRVVLDFVSFECLSWPSAASSWISRDRYEGWPGESFIQSVKAEGCLVIPCLDEDGTHSLYEWQFCFALIEKRMFREIVSPHQKLGYIMFKALCRQTLTDFNKVQEALKSIFFYACERIPSELWEHVPGACILHMLDDLVIGVGERSLPNYFIPKKNMISSLSDSEIQDMNGQILMLRSQPLLFLRQVQELARLQVNGESIIDSITTEIQNFKQHRSLKKSAIDAFVPASISVAQGEIKKRKSYRKGYEALSKAYEERLAVSTCDDSLSYEMFLSGAFSGLDLKSTVWLCAYTDKILEGQLSKKLVRELCSDIQLVKIKDFLSVDVAGEYSETEMPLEFFNNLGKFCVDFAKFLYYIEKVPNTLPVLYYAFEWYKKKMEEQFKNEQGAVVTSANTSSQFEDVYMLEIAVGLWFTYHRQGQDEFFCGMLPDIKDMCERINTTEAYITLLWLYTVTKESDYMQSLTEKFKPKDHIQVTEQYFAKWNSWPYDSCYYCD